ncbi:MAG TPA: hypothetical protein VMT46_02185 [Anaerolineaceae bacterium]|nr:hypothetical protein [Anaerolineaceae bacterium]
MTLDILTTPTAHPRTSIWRSVWKLFRLRWVLLITGFLRARRRRKIGMIVIFILVLAGLAGILALSIGALSLLRSPGLARVVDLAPLYRIVPNLIFTSAFAGLLVTSFGVLLQALYLANDMDFLLASPIPMRAVFITKLVQAILPNFGLISLFGLPVLVGMGIANGYNFLYYVFLLVLLVTVALSAAGLSSLLVMGIVRIFPARRVAEVLAFFGAIISFLCSQSGQFTRTFNFPASRTSPDQAVSALSRIDVPWSPFAWAGNGLLDIAQGNWLPGLGLLLLFTALGFGIFIIALLSAERLYYSGWARIQVSARKKRAAPRASPAAGETPLPASRTFSLSGWIPAPIRAIVRKDWLMLRRDLRNMSQLVTPLLFGIIYSVTLFRGKGPGGGEETPHQISFVLNNLLVYANIAISLFVGWSLQTRLAMMGFSQEGKSYWILKSSPLSSGRMVLAKYIVAYLPSLAIGWIFLILITLLQGAGLSILWFGLLVVGLCVAGSVGVNLAFGVSSANLNWDDPRRMMRGTAGCVAGLVSFAFLAFSLLLFFGPPVLFDFLKLPPTLGQIAGLAAGGLFSLACAVLPPRFVLDRVPRIGEE